MSFQETYTKLAKLHKEMIRRLSSRKKVASRLVEKRVPEVVDNLIARKIITPESKMAMVDNLKDHAKCLLFIDNLSENVRPYALGTPTRKYENGAQGERESDRVFKEILLSTSTNLF